MAINKEIIFIIIIIIALWIIFTNDNNVNIENFNNIKIETDIDAITRSVSHIFNVSENRIRDLNVFQSNDGLFSIKFKIKPRNINQSNEPLIQQIESNLDDIKNSFPKDINLGDNIITFQKLSLNNTSLNNNSQINNNNTNKTNNNKTNNNKTNNNKTDNNNKKNNNITNNNSNNSSFVNQQKFIDETIDKQIQFLKDLQKGIKYNNNMDKFYKFNSLTGDLIIDNRGNLVNNDINDIDINNDILNNT